jgi:Ran GTPase-activating protein (RanGAP) involved in mRNA processing and transport
LSRAALGCLGGSPVLHQLRHLNLGLNYIGTPIENSPPQNGVVALTSLDLSENAFGPEAVEMLISVPGLGQLRRLVLERNEIGNAGAATLAEWSGAASLNSLALTRNGIGDDGARVLARSPYFHQLTELNLSDNPIHDPGAFAFLDTASLPRLRRLGLPHLGLTPQVRRALAARYSG